MARPSDFYPRGIQFDHNTLDTFEILFTTEPVTFHEDSALTLVLFSSKNDAARTGFEIKIPPRSQPLVDSMTCLRYYIDRMQAYWPATIPVFLTLKCPYKAIAHATVAMILKTAIQAAGLGGQGFIQLAPWRQSHPTGAMVAIASGQHHGSNRIRPVLWQRSHPTGAMAAVIASGCLPETVMHLRPKRVFSTDMCIHWH